MKFTICQGELKEVSLQLGLDGVWRLVLQTQVELSSGEFFLITAKLPQSEVREKLLNKAMAISEGL